ncbi:MAG TPA: DUF4293 domain-containing protein [Ferruginibacter sp.]|nr:DUF4293 domain-containing protein [Ferruginibacter sp.]
MIQRIQSVWLLLASACAFATFKLPFYTGIDNTGTNTKLIATHNILIMITTIIVGTLALLTIFLFKNRTLQLRLCVLGILLEAVLIFLYYREANTFTDGTYALYALLHSLVVIFFFLAARGINKDGKLIKSTDRLR